MEANEHEFRSKNSNDLCSHKLKIFIVFPTILIDCPRMGPNGVRNKYVIWPKRNYNKEASPIKFPLLRNKSVRKIFVQVIGFKYLESLVRLVKREKKTTENKNYATYFFANINFRKFRHILCIWFQSFHANKIAHPIQWLPVLFFSFSLQRFNFAMSHILFSNIVT